MIGAKPSKPRIYGTFGNSLSRSILGRKYILDFHKSPYFFQTGEGEMFSTLTSPFASFIPETILLSIRCIKCVNVL
jgi:hypothetical protein